MALDLNETQSIVREIVKTIDKKVTCSAELAEREQRAVALVKLALRNKSTQVQIPLQDVELARENPQRRHHVRTLLKRRYDAMVFVAPPNHMKEGPQPLTEGFFRSSGGGRGRR